MLNFLNLKSWVEHTLVTQKKIFFGIFREPDLEKFGLTSDIGNDQPEGNQITVVTLKVQI